MTPLQHIAQLRALYTLASGGVWRAPLSGSAPQVTTTGLALPFEEHDEDCPEDCDGRTHEVVVCECSSDFHEGHEHDGNLIAAMHEALLPLLAIAEYAIEAVERSPSAPRIATARHDGLRLHHWLAEFANGKTNAPHPAALLRRAIVGDRFRCALCAADPLAEPGPIEVGLTHFGIQAWCTRHNQNVVHVNFDGHVHRIVTDLAEMEADAIKVSPDAGG